MNNRFFRTIVCFVLIFTFVFAVSPFRVNAVALPTDILIYRNAADVVASALIALGVGAKADVSDFNHLVTDTLDMLKLTNPSLINARGQMPLYKHFFEDKIGQVVSSFYAPDSILNQIRNHLFTDKVLVPPIYLSDKVDFCPFVSGGFNVRPFEGCSDLYIFAVVDRDKVIAYGVSRSTQGFYINGSSCGSSYDSKSGLYYFRIGVQFFPSNQTALDAVKPGVPLFKSLSEGLASYDKFVTKQNLQLYNVGTKEQDVQTVYTDWGSITYAPNGMPDYPNDDPNGGVNNKIANLYLLSLVTDLNKKIDSITQSDAQNPEPKPYDPNNPDPDTLPENNPSIIEHGLFNTLMNWLQPLIDGFQSMLSKLFQPMFDGIINSIRDIFVPEEDFITDKITQLRTRFAFADSIIATGQAIGDSLNCEGEPPKIYVDLSKSRSKYYNFGSGKVAILDMSWYSEYKPEVDLILSSLIWVIFGWTMFKRLPGLISGVSGDFKFKSADNLEINQASDRGIDS